MKKININIQDLLDKEERNIAWLSRQTGLNYSALHKFVNNQTNSVNFDTIIKVCDALNCDIKDIIELKD